jgi:hypothetical protein
MCSGLCMYVNVYTCMNMFHIFIGMPRERVNLCVAVYVCEYIHTCMNMFHRFIRCRGRRNVCRNFIFIYISNGSFQRLWTHIYIHTYIHRRNVCRNMICIYISRWMPCGQLLDALWPIAGWQRAFCAIFMCVCMYVCMYVHVRFISTALWHIHACIHT